jgi:benzoyl-CoA reductase subunit B
MVARREVRYPTEPIKCWPKMKELRRKHFRHTWEALERGDPMRAGIGAGPLAFIAGFGNYANPSYGPYYTGSMRDHALGVKFLEAAEARGYPRETCSSIRNHLGQLSLGLSTRGPNGETFKPTFVIQDAMCPSMCKIAQIYADELGVPHYIFDVPQDDNYETRIYYIEQMRECIDYLEKTTGRKFDDEAFIEALKNSHQSSYLVSQVHELTKVIPAPVDMRQLQSLHLPLVTGSHKREVVEYCEELLDEVRDRVKRGISARGFEQARFTLEGIPPFFWMGLYHLPERYNSIFVSGGIVLRGFDIVGGRSVPVPSMEELLSKLGIEELRTREDGFKVVAEEAVRRGAYMTLTGASNLFIQRARDWHCDAIVIHIDRGCYGAQCGMEETKLALDKAGIPTMTFEGSQADCRLLDEAGATKRFDIFCETMGLRKAEPRMPSKEDLGEVPAL